MAPRGVTHYSTKAMANQPHKNSKLGIKQAEAVQATLYPAAKKLSSKLLTTTQSLLHCLQASTRCSLMLVFSLQQVISSTLSGRLQSALRA